MADLSHKRCIPCEGGIPKFSREEAEKYLTMVDGWTLNAEGTEISKKYKFKSFVEAMEFANKITRIAEEEGHHPDLSIGWGRVGVSLSTHAVKGLSENDFILAAKIDTL